VERWKSSTIDQYSASPAWQKTWTSPTFSTGTHTIKLVHVTGSYVGIDAIQILASLPTSCFTLTLNHAGQGSDPVASPANSTGCPAGQFVSGEHISLSGVTPDAGWQISSWTGTDNDASTGNTNTVTMPAGAHAASVTYTENSTGGIGAGKYDDTDPAWTYSSGGWAAASLSSPFNNTLHYSKVINDYATLVFEGTQFILTYTGYPNRGQMEAYVDDVLEGTIDQYSASPAWQKTWSSPTFTNGTHTLKLVHTTGSYVGVDAIQILAPLPPGEYDDTDPAWTYSGGGWAAASLSGPYNNTLHYSNTIDDFASLEFDGTQFILTYTGYPNRGEMEVYVDDVLEGTIDQYSASPTWQKTWVSPLFTNGTHTLKLVHTTGPYVGIDAIQILP